MFRHRPGPVALLAAAAILPAALLETLGSSTVPVGGLALPAGAAVLPLSALPGLRSTRRMGLLLALQGVLALGVVGLGAVGLAWPALVPAVPASGGHAAITLMAGGGGLFAPPAHPPKR